ncbi:hypothetical protein BYT27DRAFT_7084938, partial [Phlegmacium glaucopus]
FLETQLLPVPEGAPATLATLSAALFQISALAKIPKEAVQVIQAVAWLLDKVEVDAMAGTTQEAANGQLDYLNEEIKLLTDHIHTTTSLEVEKQVGVLSSTAKAMEARLNQPAPYKEGVLGQARASEGEDPRITAQVGSRARQFIIDFPAGSSMQAHSQAEVLKHLNEAIVKANGEGEVEMHKIRVVEKLANKGFVGEFLHDDGAKWLAQQNHADTFISRLGDEGVGAQFKKRSHPVIAYYVPLNLDANSPERLQEITEVNNILAGDLLGICWVKQPAQRSPTQTCGHLLLFLTSPDTANRAKTEGLCKGN